MARLHRNNAAEWVMVVALMPVVWMMRLLRRAKREPSGFREPSGSAAGPSPAKPVSRPVRIEGLPPRTMN
jgi:hypothetical protein